MKKFFPLLLLAVSFAPLCAFAAGSSVFLQTPARAVNAGDTVLVPVMLAVPEGAAINSLQAMVSVSGPAHLESVSTGGSLFTIWPQEPVVESDKASFVGGLPGSAYGSPLRAATLVITATGAGTVRVSVSGATAYSGDGKGTPQKLADAGISFAVGSATGSVRNDLSGSIAADRTPPDPFTIMLGRDPSLYGGKYFITYPAADAASGVSRYEIIDNGAPTLSTTSTSAALTDQSLEEIGRAHV